MVTSSLDNFCGSLLWDENVVWNTTNPDFPDCFQKTVLLWVTYGFLWLLTPLEIYYLATQKYQCIPWTALNVSKMVLGLMLIIANVTEFAYLLVVGMEDQDVFLADLWAPMIRALTFLLAFTLILAGKIRGYHSSGILFIFWILITVSGAVTYRTHISIAMSEDQGLDSLLFAMTAMKFPMIVAELILSAFSDTVITDKEDDKNSLPLNRASFLSIIFFSWFDKLVWYGFRHQITEKDLWTLEQEFRSSEVNIEFEKHWEPKSTNPHIDGETLTVTQQEKSWPSTLTILWKMNRFNFCMSVILKLMSDAFTFMSPLLLRELINFVSNPNEPVWRGYLYTVILFLSSLLQSITTHNYFFRFQAIGIRARATIIAAIYRKALRMSSVAKRTSTVGEIVNLMSIDAQRILDFWPYIGYALTTPLIVVVALYLLWELLGPSVFAGLAVVIIMIPINLVLASFVSSMQSKLMKYKDERTKIMNEVLSGMKVLKLYAWELSFNEQVNKIRKQELKILKKFLFLNSFTTMLFQFTPFLISMTTFATYVLIDEKNILDASKAFVALSLFDLIRYPLTYVPIVISYTIQAMISIGRVNNFMIKPELDPANVTEPKLDEDPVIIQNGVFSWCPEDEPILRDISLNIRKGSLVAVVGQVGAGKSSLISAILGEMEKRSGIVKRQRSVAYVAQQAWIQNSTLCQNILFGRQMIEKKYNAVLDACALRPDLEILPGGDQTEIGEKGINLSGGQKQRISLARAVYNDAELYLLDDPLSAVDSHVGKHIFEHVIGSEGLLKEKTRILVTHSLAYLPLVDSIIVMSNGTISEMGSYKDLLEAGGAFADFILTYLKEAEEIDEAEVAELLDIQENILSHVENSELKRKISVRISRALSSEDETFVEGSSPENGPRHRTSSGRIRSTSSTERKPHESFTNKDLLMKKGTFLTQMEQVETGSVGWLVYYYYFKSSGLTYCIIALLVLVVSWSGSVGSNIWLSSWSGDKPLPDGSQDISLRNLRLGVYAGLGGIQALFGLFSSIILVWANIKASSVLHNGMLLNVLRSPMSFFDTTPLGRIMNRFSRDIDIIDSTVPSFIRPLGDSVLQIIGVIIVICMGTPIFAVILIPLGIIYYLIQRIFISSSRQMKRLESVTRSPIFSHFSETIAGLSTIRAYRQLREFTRESDRRVDVNHTIFYPFLVAKRWLGIRLDLVGAMVVFSAAILAVIGKETLDPGTVGLSISYGLSVTFVLTLLVRYWTELESNSVSIERIKEYTNTPTEAAWEREEFRPVSSWPDEGHVKMDHYSTRYREGLDLVLRGITCDIHGGEKIGIVGRTGAGKSSLTLALFRIIESAEGSITIDGINIANLGLHDLRSRLTIIPQDPVLFCGSLRMNLDPFDKYSDEEVWQALENSHLKEFIMSLPQGLYYQIVEGGENLSIGQRQLVCLARALLRKTKVLVLDEATAAVDLETDDLIQATIRKEFAECTVLTIAHRLNTIMDSTRVMVLDNGTILEFDSPSSLLENPQSSFYSMARDAGLV